MFLKAQVAERIASLEIFLKVDFFRNLPESGLL